MYVGLKKTSHSEFLALANDDVMIKKGNDFKVTFSLFDLKSIFKLLKNGI